MKLRVFEQQKEPGFRLNLMDIVLVLGCLAASGWLYTLTEGMSVSLVPAHCVATFFLFCNVFRVRQRQEVAWVAIYGATVAAALWLDLPFWPAVLSVSLPATAAVIAWAYLAGEAKGIWIRPHSAL